MPDDDLNSLSVEERRAKAAAHIAEARRVLKGLDQHSSVYTEVEELILKLELALNSLTVKTGGML
jgi:hypothetical protein